MAMAALTSDRGAGRVMGRPELEPARSVTKFGNDEHPEAGRGDQQSRRDGQSGDHAGGDRFQAEEADLIDIVEDGVPHGSLYALSPA